MGPKCHTEADEFWESYLDGRYEGYFTITEVDGGFFRGEFNDDPRDPIEGSCTGATIDFTRHAIELDYSGVFYGQDSKYIRGIRRGRRRDHDKGGRPDDETWDGTKTGGNEDEPKNRPPLRKRVSRDS